MKHNILPFRLQGLTFYRIVRERRNENKRRPNAGSAFIFRRGMKYVIFADVHSNYEALKTFFLYTDHFSGNIKRVCLGDVAGYSAQPNECLRLLLKRNIPIIMGNHDYGVIHLNERRDTFNEVAKQAILWQSRIISDANKRILVELPYLLSFDGLFSAVHGDYTNPKEFNYVSTIEEAQNSMSAMKTPIGFVGHTHIPSIYIENPGENGEDRFIYIKIEDNNRVFYLDENRRYLINPGSLGQPRDGNPRASFVLFNSDEMSLKFYRMSYNIKQEALRIRSAKLPELLADRIQHGY